MQVCSSGFRIACGALAYQLFNTFRMSIPIFWRRIIRNGLKCSHLFKISQQHAYTKGVPAVPEHEPELNKQF